MKRYVEVDVKPTPEEMAEHFCNMFDYEQAEFFNKIAELVKDWQDPFCFQLQAIVDTNELSRDASNIMKQIGEYAVEYWSEE
jgi:hypothetical protein